MQYAPTMVMFDADGSADPREIPAFIDRATRARQYVDGGAAAISVLTEPSRFDGSLEHLDDVAAAVNGTPVMRKDFLVDTVQVLEARAAGASGVLLIAAMLDDRQLRSMLDCAAEHGLFVLLESFDEEDLTRSSRLLDKPADRERADAGQLLKDPAESPRRSESPEWLSEALGETKQAYACRIIKALRDNYPGSIILRTLGRQYAHEPRPRWSLGLYRRRDGRVLADSLPLDPLGDVDDLHLVLGKGLLQVMHILHSDAHVAFGTAVQDYDLHFYLRILSG